MWILNTLIRDWNTCPFPSTVILTLRNHILLITLENKWIWLFSLRMWVDRKADLALTLVWQPVLEKEILEFKLDVKFETDGHSWALPVHERGPKDRTWLPSMYFIWLIFAIQSLYPPRQLIIYMCASVGVCVCVCLYVSMRLFVWVYDISTFVGYLMPNPFYTNNQFYFKQFSLTWVHSIILKNTFISSYSG